MWQNSIDPPHTHKVVWLWWWWWGNEQLMIYWADKKQRIFVVNLWSCSRNTAGREFILTPRLLQLLPLGTVKWKSEVKSPLMQSGDISLLLTEGWAGIAFWDPEPWWGGERNVNSTFEEANRRYLAQSSLCLFIAALRFLYCL